MSKEKRPKRRPRSSAQINERIIASGRVVSETSSGDHRTFRIKSVGEGPTQILTIIQGEHDLLNSHPKVWHRLMKQMRNLSLLGLAGFAILEAGKQILTGAVEFGSSRPSVRGSQENLG